MMRKMDGKIIVANWKANKTLEEAIPWVETVGQEILKLRKKVILCPPSIFIIPLAAKIEGENLTEFLILGSQNISHYSAGAYTGEIAVDQLTGFVSYTLVGHSERRRYFGETSEQVAAKFNLAKEFGITPILCFDITQIEEVYNLAYADLVCAFEPVSAIGTGNPDTPENAHQIVTMIKSKNPTAKVLYGGSVTYENIDNFLGVCDGALVGSASLSPDDFLPIVSAIS